MDELLVKLKTKYSNITLSRVHLGIYETSLNSFMIRRKCYEELGIRCIVKTESQ
uniref:Uncharacterized protein n=1 Tax=Virus NIOZ-UU159 TaxID=2763270 RepID=A0A7S9SVA2_9VIRU|nr:MAG: hypothetical protein NIOZUU159_00380 [Virus NIOZ-UU159]